MATTVLGLKTFAASDPVDYNEINDNYNKIDNGVKTALHGRAAHNMLDNSDFTNPVNQRGATTATLGKYFIDRWNTEPFPSGPSITIDSNGLTLLPTTSSTAGIYQILPDYENRKGKVHTFAICVNNVWKCVSFTMGNFGVGYFIHGLAFFSVDNRNILIRNNASDTPAPITIQRVALYEGSYTAETLPSYVPKGKHVEMLNCGVSLAPYNLLDNSDFRNPVNQRGKTSYTGEASKLTYTIDRWNIWDTHAKTEVTASGLKITGIDVTGYIAQLFEKPDKMVGKTYTLAAGMSNGTILCGTATVPSTTQTGEYYITAVTTSDTTPGLRLQVAGDLSKVRFQFAVKPGKTCIIAWAALYEGSYDASTLPPYQPKGYAAELAECMRYYQQYNTNGMSAVGDSESGITYIRCPLQVPMRTAPSLVQSSVEMWTTYSGTTNKTEVFTFYASNPQCVHLKCTSSTGSAYQLVIATNNAAMAFSADL